MGGIIIYLCIGFMVMEIACSPNDPNAWRAGVRKQYKTKADRLGFMATCILLWPLVLAGALSVIFKGGNKK